MTPTKTQPEKRSALALALALAAATVALVTAPAAWADQAPASTAVERGRHLHVPVSLALVPQVSTGGLAAGERTTNVSLSLGADAYGHLRGAGLSVGANWATRTAYGAQLAAGINYAGDAAAGAQLAAGGNVAGYRMRGAQLAAGMNFTRGHLTGTQITSGFNYAGHSMQGAQLAAGMNFTRGHVAGTQITSGFNYAGSLTGLQLGIINVGTSVKGSQVGIINLGGRVRGAQIGIINLADDVDAPIGILSLVKNGQHHLDLWGSDTAAVNAGFKLGSKHVYTLLGAGIQPGDESSRWMLGMGLGAHIPVSDRVFVNADLVAWHINEGGGWTSDLNLLPKARLMGGYRFHERLAVYGGVTANLLVTRVNDGSDFGLFRGPRLTSESRETTVRMWPGFVVGIQL